MNNTNNRFLHHGSGLVAVLCFLSFSACGGPGSGNNDSGMVIMPDGGPMADAGDIPPPDAGPTPDGDAGMTPDAGVPDLDSGTSSMCVRTQIEVRDPVCGAENDLPPPMVYSDSGMNTACMSTLTRPHTWASSVSSGIGTDLFREPGTNQWMINFGDGDGPYDGLYHLGPDGNWYANWPNAGMPGIQGNHGVLRTTADCRSMSGEFFHGGESTPYRTQSYWLE